METIAQNSSKTLFSKAMLAFIVLITVLFLGLAYLFYQNSSRLLISAQTRTILHQTIEAAYQTLSALKDLETAQRGYLLTQDKSYLQPYQQGAQDLALHTRELTGFLQHDPSEQQFLQTIHTLIPQKKEEMDLTLSLANAKGPAAALDVVQSNHGKLLMDEIRRQFKQLVDNEVSTLARHNDIMNKYFKNTLQVALLGFFLIIILAISAYYTLQREITHREEVYRALQEESNDRGRLNQELQHEIKHRISVQGEIEQLNKELQSNNETLNALNKELESFSYSVSHDLRTPLRSISGFSQALLRRNHDQLDEEGKDYLERILANTQRMGSLIDDILQLSRLNRGDIKKESFNLSELANETTQELSRQDPERRVDISIDPEMNIFGDKRLLQAVLQNLIGNAWKFTAEKPVPKIEIGKKNVNNKTTYYVKDNGAGFDMQYAHKLFGAFQRLHAINEFPGNGIGLATVQRIIHRHGGEVWAEGAVDEGATFFFSI